MKDILLATVVILWLITVGFAIKIIVDLMHQLPDAIAEVISMNRVSEIYPCTLLIHYVYSAECPQTAYDFSLYDKKKVIGLTVFDQRAKEEVATEIYRRLLNCSDLTDMDVYNSIYSTLEDGMVIPNTYVYKTKGGDYLRLL
jgi:hypothetical protein